ncbi:MAG TPA: CehA/McbA family metallohydrolase [Phycisphaerae bacterium]|nr:CehA/McbA family metallohydrolase [Phycisphaerae bacterium]
MAPRIDGPSSNLFTPLPLRGKVSLTDLAAAGVSPQMAEAADRAPTGACTAWGIPLTIGKAVVVKDTPVTVTLANVRAPWLIFAHTSDIRPPQWNADGFITASAGRARFGERAADYVLVYADGTEARAAVRRGFEVGAFSRPWGDNPVCAVSDAKPKSLPSHSADVNPNRAWGRLQTRADSNDFRPWVNWLWAWENPHPDKAIAAVRFEPAAGTVVVSAVTAGKTAALPTQWEPRRKAVLTLPKGRKLDRSLDEQGRLQQIQLDMGQVISVAPRKLYPDRTWAKTYNNRVPELSDREVLVEYAAHADARFHLPGGRTVPVAKVASGGTKNPIRAVRPADRKVTLRVIDKQTRQPVAVKLHVHGAAGEHLTPVDRHRIPNPDWFQDYSVDFVHQGVHVCSYINGEADLNLPRGPVYVEVSKGFEIRPVRKVFQVTGKTREITIELQKVLPWRDNGWVTADTHVHFLSPNSALLEGAGEGVNVVNLLASQWGELMTNAGDFDGATTHGSRQAGGDGEYLVRVGTENRQHVMGHISLLGYSGRIIAPMTTGGPDESALGDAVEVLLTEWARQCHAQGGVVVIPHFPNPRLENAAVLVGEDADAVEMTAWGFLYGGIDPYTLSDWYRYLNCGYMTAAVGGTDKMSATTAVGTVRTYAKLPPSKAFTYDAWMDAVRKAHTFVTYGPLMEFAVEGKGPGSRIRMPRTGGTVDVTWKLASVTVPMSKVELIVNGEIRASQPVKPEADEGHFSIKCDRSSWLALLVRGHYADKPEIIAAHSSPVMVDVKGSDFFAAADAMTILDQIEGALAFLDTAGTRAETAARKRMKLVLTAAHRKLHNRMHSMGKYHKHTATQDHPEHH